MPEPRCQKTALGYALACIGRRRCTYAQLDEKLRLKNYDNEDRRLAFTKLTAWGYIDDMIYAVDFCRTKQTRASRRQVAYDLRQRGIAPETIEQALAAEYTEEEEKDFCRALLRREWDKKAEKSILSRIVRKFVQKGYPYPIIRQILEEEKIISPLDSF